MRTDRESFGIRSADKEISVVSFAGKRTGQRR